MSNSLIGGLPGGLLRPERQALSQPAATAVVVLALAVCALPYGFIVPGAVIAAALLVWSFQRPVVAVAMIIVGQFLLLDRTETISIPEIVYGAYFFGFLTWWFVRRVFVDGLPVAGHGVDRVLLAYLAYGALSVIPSLVVGTDLLGWFREYLTVATLFLYFPLREILNGEPERRVVFGAGALLVIAIAINNMVNYGLKAAAANYLWELLGARQAANAHFLFPALIALGALAVHLEGPKRFVAAFAWLSVGAALVLTFARGFWIGAVVGTGVVYLLSPRTVRSRAARYALIIALVSTAGVLLFGGDFSGRLLQSVGDRLVSSGKSLDDISLRARFVESQAILERSLWSPVVGNGVGARFTFYDVLSKVTVTTPYSHDGYLFLLFKVGIIGTGMFIVWLGWVLRLAWTTSRTAAPLGFNAGMIRATAGIVVGLLLITLTSNVFIERASLLVMASFSALVLSHRSPYPRRGDSNQAGSINTVIRAR